MSKLSHKDIKQNATMYDRYFERFHMDDGWLPYNQRTNFQLMMRLTEFTGVPISGASCLDMGCGTGDLSRFLRQYGAKEYLGLDIYESSLKKAHHKYPDEVFLQSDFLAYTFNTKFDYAFCSGALTINLPDIDNYTFLEEAVTKMWNHTNIGLVFNILTDEDSIIDPDLFFYNRRKVEELCSQIASGGHTISEKTPGEVFQIHVYMYRDTKQI